jgi:hypothetical protein
MKSINHSKQSKRSRWVMGWMVLVFLLPLAVSSFLYYHHHQVLQSMQSGQIIKPGIKLKTHAWRLSQTQKFSQTKQEHIWQMLYVIPKKCTFACGHELNLLTRVHRALGPEQKRVTILALNLDGIPPKAVDPKVNQLQSLHRLFTKSAEWKNLFKGKNTYGKIEKPGKLFVVDPLKNIIMSYQTPIPNDGLLKDIKRLLRVSHLG